MTISDDVTMTDTQTFYYLDSNVQLELNIRYIKQQLLKILELVEDIGCFVCDRIKCCCVGQISDNKDDRNTLTSDNDQFNHEKIEAVNNKEALDEFGNVDNDIDNEDDSEDDYATAKDATANDSSTEDDDDSDMIDDPHESILRAPIMASSPFEYLLSPKSPPAQTLPRPQFNANTKDNQIDKPKGDAAKIDNKYKKVDDWIKSVMDKEFPKDVKENTINLMNISWPGANVNWGGIDQVNTPVEDFFRSFTRQPQPPLEPISTQTAFLTSSFLKSFRLQHRSPYM